MEKTNPAFKVMGVEVDYDITGALVTPPTDIPTAFLG